VGETSYSTIRTRRNGRVSHPKTSIPGLALEIVYERKTTITIRKKM